MLGEREARERLVAIFVIGLLLVNYPLLYLVAEDVTWFGVPGLYLYLFGLWVVLIVAIGVVAERVGRSARQLSSDVESD